MIIIDGQQSQMHIGNFANLEEILVQVVNEDAMNDRIVTDVIVNQETFSEIYPHQAEDIASDLLRSVEVRSVPVSEMAVNIAREMYKVSQIMANGSRQVSRMFRQAEDAEALELFQDLLDVTRDFMAMLSVLRSEFSLANSKEFIHNSDQFSALLSEMTEVLENEDWILLADLLEYEFLPVCENWKKVIQLVREDIRQSVRN